MICGKIAQAQSARFHTTMVLGVTGGIGCGKSTASKLFEPFGYARVDSDALIRAAIFTQPDVVEQIATRFGSDAVTASGEIDRVVLARHVFNNDDHLRWLEDLVHPRLYAEWRRILAESNGADLVFEVPLLFEKRLEIWFDFTICVASSSAHQLARLAERGMSHALAEQRISKQLPLAQKIESADFVLLNDGALSFLGEQVAMLVALLRQLR